MFIDIAAIFFTILLVYTFPFYSFVLHYDIAKSSISALYFSTVIGFTITIILSYLLLIFGLFSINNAIFSYLVIILIINYFHFRKIDYKTPQYNFSSLSIPIEKIPESDIAIKSRLSLTET